MEQSSSFPSGSVVSARVVCLGMELTVSTSSLGFVTIRRRLQAYKILAREGAPDLRDRNALQRVHQQHAGYEVSCTRRQVARQIVDAALHQAPYMSRAGYGSTCTPLCHCCSLLKQISSSILTIFRRHVRHPHTSKRCKPLRILTHLDLFEEVGDVLVIEG